VQDADRPELVRRMALTHAECYLFLVFVPDDIYPFQVIKILVFKIRFRKSPPCSCPILVPFNTNIQAPCFFASKEDRFACYG